MGLVVGVWMQVVALLQLGTLGCKVDNQRPGRVLVLVWDGTRVAEVYGRVELRI